MIDRATVLAGLPVMSFTLACMMAGCTEDGVATGSSDAVHEPTKALHLDGSTANRFGRVPLHAGFSPDPRLVTGTAAGEVEAATIGRHCSGWISKMPDYLLDADTAFFQLYLIGRSRSNISLVLRKPDGSVTCTRERRVSTEPMIRSALPIGTSRIWVGVEEEGATAKYRLGFSEVKWQPSSVPLPDAH